jgi:5-formyltetrahydrofolate cyclo-ligase
MRAVRRSIGHLEATLAAEAASARILGLAGSMTGRTAMTFWPFGSEIPIDGLAARLAAAGARVVMPFLDSGEVRAAAIDPGARASTVPSEYGPAEPADRTPVPEEQIDLVVVPGLAFDRAGNRLGHGGGHYDRFLTRLRPDAVAVGVCFACQLVDSVPSATGDVPVDAVVTERETIEIPSKRRLQEPGSPSAPAGR